MNLIFYIASAIAIFATLMVITRVNAVHALLYLIVSLLSVAIIFFLLGAPFVAALEIIIYAGAIMVLFIFVIMMLNLSKGAEQEHRWLQPNMWIGPAVLAFILLVEFVYVMMQGESPGHSAVTTVDPKQVGISLYSTYLIGVELAGMLLMAGIIGAYHLGREKKEVLHRFLKEVKS